MKKIIKDMVTGKDGKTYDIGRILTVIVMLFYIAMEIMDVRLTHTFECKDWAEGAMYILGGSGLLLFLKKNTEPEN